MVELDVGYGVERFGRMDAASHQRGYDVGDYWAAVHARAVYELRHGRDLG